VGDDDSRAFLWSGRADTATDLHPAGFDLSAGYATTGTRQVGVGLRTTGSPVAEALLWNGTAASAISLHPAGFEESVAAGAWGGSQVGSGSRPGESLHALLWFGTAASVVDLHPSGYQYSTAEAVHGDQQVGKAGLVPGAGPHALLWTGTASSAVDLHPAGASTSGALATNGTYQVGYTTTAGGPTRAALWAGTHESFVDLHALLPPGRFSSSDARGIDDLGNIVGSALEIRSGFFQPVVWTIVPEPSVVAALAMIGGATLLRRPTRRWGCEGRKFRRAITPSPLRGRGQG
jgi:hypothetical protein